MGLPLQLFLMRGDKLTKGVLASVRGGRVSASMDCDRSLLTIDEHDQTAMCDRAISETPVSVSIRFMEPVLISSLANVIIVFTPLVDDDTFHRTYQVDVRDIHQEYSMSITRHQDTYFVASIPPIFFSFVFDSLCL